MQSSAVHVQLLHHSSPTMPLSTLQASGGSHPMKKVAKYQNTKDAPNPQYTKGETYSVFLTLISHVRIQGNAKNKTLCWILTTSCHVIPTLQDPRGAVSRVRESICAVASEQTLMAHSIPPYPDKQWKQWNGLVLSSARQNVTGNKRQSNKPVCFHLF